MILYLIPITSLVLLIIWSWFIIDVLRKEQDYLWLIVLILVPPLGIPAYLINFRILGDEERGLTAFRRRVEREHRIADLHSKLRETEIVGHREELAALLIDKGDWTGALEQLKHVHEFDAEDLRAQHQAGYALLKLGRVSEALAHLEYVFHEAPDFAGYRAGALYAEALERNGDGAAALDVYRRMLKRVTLPELVVDYAESLLRQQQPAEAATALREMIQHVGDEAALSRSSRAALATARKMLSSLSDAGK